MCTSYGRIAPTNYILLGIFTLAESYLVSMICAMTSPDIVVMAAIFTGVIFSALTTYAFRTKTDFTIAGGALYMFGMGLTTFGFLLFFTDNKFLHLVYGFFGSIFFGLYLIWDT
jgi:FtsH-binding integral membrane protein